MVGSNKRRKYVFDMCLQKEQTEGQDITHVYYFDFTSCRKLCLSKQIQETRTFSLSM